MDILWSTYHSTCKCDWTPGNALWDCGAQPAHGGSWELWGHFLPPKCQDSEETEEDCLWDQVDILTSRKKQWIFIFKKSVFQPHSVPDMEYCIKHKLQRAMQISFLSFGLFTQISPDMIFWSYTWEYPIHLLSKRLLFLSTETWLMIHKTHFPHCGVTVINCFVEPGGLSRESGLVHNCCVRTDTLNPELLSRLKMTHQSSLTWSCALFKQASEKRFLAHN